jgi:hypothetical protein
LNRIAGDRQRRQGTHGFTFGHGTTGFVSMASAVQTRGWFNTVRLGAIDGHDPRKNFDGSRVAPHGQCP